MGLIRKVFSEIKDIDEAYFLIAVQKLLRSKGKLKPNLTKKEICFKLLWLLIARKFHEIEFTRLQILNFIDEWQHQNLKTDYLLPKDLYFDDIDNN